MVQVKFETGNAALRDENGKVNYEEAARLLRKVADQVANGYDDGVIIDYNGNPVGTFKVR